MPSKQHEFLLIKALPGSGKERSLSSSQREVGEGRVGGQGRSREQRALGPGHRAQASGPLLTTPAPRGCCWWQAQSHTGTPPALPTSALVQRLPGGVAGEGVVAGHAVGLPGEGGPPPPAPPQRAEAGQGGQEDLAEIGRDQVVEDRVDGGADVEEGVGQHVEVVVEVVEEPGQGEGNMKGD